MIFTFVFVMFRSIETRRDEGISEADLLKSIDLEFRENDLFPPTDITEDSIREIALPMGLVDVKVCAVDAVWSGLKLVIRKELRGR